MKKNKQKKVTDASGGWEWKNECWQPIQKTKWEPHSAGNRKVWPSKCPQCGKPIRIEVPTSGFRRFRVNRKGELVQIGSWVDDTMWDIPAYSCMNDNCNFEYQEE